MTWRFWLKYIIFGLVLIPVGIELYTIIRYHGIYAGGRGMGTHYYTLDRDPISFVTLTILYSIIGVPVIVGALVMVLADLGIGPRERFYKKKNDEDVE